jgi:hypothetical protein
MSATILGSTFLVPIYLGPITKAIHPLALLHKEAGGKNYSQGRSTTPPNPPQGLGPLPAHTMDGTNPPPPPPMPYFASLNIPDLSKLMNDPILHDPTWPNMPTKLPSNIPKFEGKSGEDPANHVMTFHLWCLFKQHHGRSISLSLFQRTLTGPSAKWYVDEKSGSHVTFESLAKAFLDLFQLLVHHDTGLELLSK